MKNIKAFTLAETLLSLTIIGVIAVMTMPSLFTDTRKQQNYVCLTKAYSTISNATDMIKVEKGNPKFWDWNTIINNDYINKISVNCSNCFPSSYSGGLNDISGISTTFITSDFMFWGVEVGGTYRATFYVDVNGVKGPNEQGQDIFAFGVATDGVHPYGDGGITCTAGNLDLTCTAKALHDGEISW